MRKIWHRTSLMLAGMLFLLLAGCGNSIISDVTRFHNLPAPNGETIEVVSINPALQNSLEFGQYAELVGKHLGTIGYMPPQNTPSKLVARIGYNSQPSSRYIDDGPRSSVDIGMSGGSHHSSIGVGVGVSFPISQSAPRIEHVHTLTLEIIRRSDGVRLYEGHVTNRSYSGLPEAIPHLIEALFQDFPGKSGTSNKVKTKSG